MISRFFKDFTWPFYEVYEEDWFTFYLIILLACLFQATILSVNYQIILLENNGKLLSTNFHKLAGRKRVGSTRSNLESKLSFFRELHQFSSFLPVQSVGDQAGQLRRERRKLSSWSFLFEHTRLVPRARRYRVSAPGRKSTPE